MTILKISSVALTALIIVACNSSKKTTTSTTSSVATTSTLTPNIIPGDAELIAIKVKYPETTLTQLTEGHSIYTGACTNCHGQKNIFKRSEASWLHEIDDMSPKAKLTDDQKNALTKYILAMKATAPVPAK
jgi:mono/diheme cytochrome c family protein